VVDEFLFIFESKKLYLIEKVSKKPEKVEK
jgi:hypothetical protein